MTAQPAEAESELEGWYYQNGTSERCAFALSVDGAAVSLYAPSDRLVASWSLDQLENREIAVLSERWSIGDRRVPEAYLVLESDQDYSALRAVSPKLRPIRARLWRLLGVRAIESGNFTGYPVLLLTATAAVIWLWRNLPLEYCVATHVDRILFLKCILIDHFIPK